MDKRDILMAFKSTLDRVVGDLAGQLSAAAPAANPVKFFDLDDHDGMRQVQAGAEHALVYQYVTLAPEPRHPLYGCSFLVGAKTSNDEGNYDMTSLMVDVNERFDIGSHHDLMDWSGDKAPTDILGSMMITDCAPSAQMFENQSGIRLFQITAKVIAHG